MRDFALIAAITAAYLLLRGFPSWIPEMARSWMAVIVISVGLGGWRGRKRKNPDIPSIGTRPAWLDRATIVCTLMTLASGFALFLSSTPPPLENLAARLETFWRPGASAERENAAATAETGNWLWNDHQQRPLPQRTNLKPGNRPEVFLQPQDQASSRKLRERRIYVTAFALGRYQNQAWSTLDPKARTLLATPDGWLRLDPKRSGTNITCEVFHAANHPAGNPLTSLQGIVATELPELTRLDPGLWILPPAGKDGYRYRIVSKPCSLDDLPSDPSTQPGTRAPAEYLALPPDAQGEKLRDLALTVAGEGDPLTRLKRLRDHLRTNLGYSLRTDNPRDLEPLENFLFHEKRGHCEYFASAAALLARALGMPSRIAYGWSGGTYYENSNLFVFRSREAHAWTEVLLEGHGWTVLDATPPGALDREYARNATPGEKPPAPEELTQPEAAALTEAGHGLRGPLWLCTGFLGGALGLGLLRRRRRLARQIPGSHKQVHGRDDYLAAFRRASNRHGRPVSPSLPLRRHLAGLDDAPHFARELQAYHYSVRYEGRPPDRRIEQRLRKAAEQWR